MGKCVKRAERGVSDEDYREKGEKYEILEILDELKIVYCCTLHLPAVEVHLDGVFMCASFTFQFSRSLSLYILSFLTQQQQQQ